MITLQLLSLPAAYFLGSICAGYYLSKFLAGDNPQELGSKSLGATNVGRIYGKTGFLLTFIFDCLKGTAAAYLARSWGFSQSWIFLVGMLVVIGHIWPWQLKFSGGKGISPFLGMMVIFDYRILIIMIVLFIPLYWRLHNFSISGLAALVTLPVWLAILGYGYETIGLSILLIGILFFAHRDNLKTYCQHLQNRNILRKGD